MRELKSILLALLLRPHLPLEGRARKFAKSKIGRLNSVDIGWYYWLFLLLWGT